MQKAKIINILICVISLVVKAEFKELLEESETYTPIARFSDTDSFSYITQRSIGSTNVASATVTVLPTAQPTSIAATCDIPVTFVPNNCGISFIVIAAGPASHGTVTFSGDTITYTSSNFSGLDTFPYTIQDSFGNTSSSTVSVTVTPVAQDTDAIAFANTPVTIMPNICQSNVIIDSVGTPSNGTAFLSGNSIIYTPNTGFSGTDKFTYTITDSTGDNSSATITVTVLLVTANTTVTTMMDTPITINIVPTISAVRAVAATNVRVVATSNPHHGGARAKPNGKAIVYTPNTGFTGVDSFNYTLSDPTVGTITVNVVSPVIRSSLSSAIINKYCPAG